MAKQYEYFARCASGFEHVLAHELKGLHLGRVRPLKGGVAFFGGIADGYRACLWSRVATRMQLVLVRVGAASAQELYDDTLSFAWENHVACGATVAVEAHGTNSQLRNTTFTALKVKDALCDRLRDVRGARPNVDARHPDFAVNVAVHEQRATLYLNLSGESLHRRGYREDGTQTEAPLKETLAAGMLQAAGWTELARSGANLVDPLCGSGTLAIEAALVATNRAPGLLRRRWGFMGWAAHDAAAWDALAAEATDAVAHPTGKPRILAGDKDPQAIEIARANARRAGVDGVVSFYVGDAADLGRRLRWMRSNPAGGLLVANPPYGRRLLSRAELPKTYASLAAAIDALPRTWEVALITPDAGIDSSLGRVPHQAMACHNGPIPTWIRRYRVANRPTTLQVTSMAGTTRAVPVACEGSKQFAARLRKVARERARWAHDAGIACFRLYDADLPEYAFSIDRYACATKGADAPRQTVLVREHRRPRSVDAQQAARRLADATAIVSAVLDLPSRNVLAFEDEPQGKRGARHGTEHDEETIDVSEGGLAFSLSVAHLDAYLPLSERGVRDLVAARAHGKRLAFLFAASAGSFARAASARPASAILVDSSARQLAHAERMLRQNDLRQDRCGSAQLDPRAWLAREARSGRRYDLLVCVPPTWLPAAGKDAGEWDLRAHAQDLLRAAGRVLSDAGEVLFVSRDPSAFMNASSVAVRGMVATDLSADVASHDLARSRTKPRCWLLQKGQRG